MESKCIETDWGKEWINSDGYFHRENDLHAYEETDGYKAWYINGNRHRELGPARIWTNGEEEWFLNGIEYLPEEMPLKLYIEYLRWEYRKKNGNETIISRTAFK